MEDKKSEGLQAAAAPVVCAGRDDLAALNEKLRVRVAELEDYRVRWDQDREKLRREARENRQARAELDEVVAEMERSKVPATWPDPAHPGKTRTLSTAQRIRFMALRFIESVKHNQALERELEKQRSSAGCVLGPDGRPVGAQ